MAYVWADPEEFEERGNTGRGDYKRGASGVDGESWYMDVWAGGPDVNPDLTGVLKWMVYQEMRLGDPAVRSVLLMYKLPLRSAVWEVDPRDDSPQQMVIAEACRWAFGLGKYEGQMVEPWDQSIERSTLFLDWGSWWEEIIWGDDLVDFVAPEELGGGTYPLRPVLRLAPRSPTTLKYPDGIVIDKTTGAVKWIEQDLPDAKRIKGDKLCYLIHGFEGLNYHGVSLLRPMYGPWKLKKALMIAAGIGWDRWASGIPRATYPQGDEAARIEAEATARAVRTHERAYVVQPAGDQYGFEIVSTAGAINDPVSLLRTYDEQIALAGLQGFTRLGITETGSRAVGETLSAPYYQAVLALASQIANARHKQLIRRFVDVNFGEKYDAPLLRVTRIQAKDPAGIAGIVAELAAVGFNFADAPTQKWLRALLEMPTLPDVTSGEEVPSPDQEQEVANEGDSAYGEKDLDLVAGKKAYVETILDMLPMLNATDRLTVAREVLERRQEFEEHPDRIKTLYRRVLELRADTRF